MNTENKNFIEITFCGDVDHEELFLTVSDAVRSMFPGLSVISGSVDNLIELRGENSRLRSIMHMAGIPDSVINTFSSAVPDAKSIEWAKDQIKSYNKTGRSKHTCYWQPVTTETDLPREGEYITEWEHDGLKPIMRVSGNYIKQLFEEGKKGLRYLVEAETVKEANLGYGLKKVITKQK